MGIMNYVCGNTDVFWEEAQQSVCFICDWQTLFSIMCAML